MNSLPPPPAATLRFSVLDSIDWFTIIFDLSFAFVVFILFLSFDVLIVGFYALLGIISIWVCVWMSAFVSACVHEYVCVFMRVMLQDFRFVNLGNTHTHTHMSQWAWNSLRLIPFDFLVAGLFISNQFRFSLLQFDVILYLHTHTNIHHRNHWMTDYERNPFDQFQSQTIPCFSNILLCLQSQRNLFVEIEACLNLFPHWLSSSLSLYFFSMPSTHQIYHFKHILFSTTCAN